MKLLIINGPNLNLLGSRDVGVYGAESMENWLAQNKVNGLGLSYFQSNIEGEIIQELHRASVDGIILNAGGYTHTSVAIRDAISAIQIPVVEVHISNIAARESFRHESMISPVCIGCIFGFGMDGYRLAMEYFLFKKQQNKL